MQEIQKTIGNTIITNKTLISSTVTHESTSYELCSKLITFMRQINEANTSKSMQHVIVRMCTVHAKMRRIKTKMLSRKSINQMYTAERALT